MITASATTHDAQGSLFIVATPIGNRDDISFRALETLKNVDLILAEDTRHSRPLLTSFGITKPLSSLHAHNEAQKSEAIIAALRSGKSIALISDAGTPLISDPGFPLVRKARELGIPVVPIPGPSALITALSAAGVPCDLFTFAGFLPAKEAARRERLSTLASLSHTLVFYESTHRIIDAVSDIAAVFGECSELVLAKELTKAFERFIQGSCAEVLAWLKEESTRSKGEFVLILPPRKAGEDKTKSEKLLSLLLAELPLKQAVKLASAISGLPKNELYQKALILNKQSG
ncbi:16S rRNA (cytidine(1402)-2'-O)-methyltransferase [Legionella londiniensis]|uniref:16S rRNA (cytidine(1402)-2'-O)-methyltransferase n=1 Tax=Legionella londiniensis TaxID=45068 RepID=UPI00399C824E